MFQSEAWFRTLTDRSETRSEQVGFYIFNQFGLSETTSFGHRLDSYKDLSKLNSITQRKINNIEYGNSLEFTWKSSEFVTTRFGASHTFTEKKERRYYKIQSLKHSLSLFLARTLLIAFRFRIIMKKILIVIFLFSPILALSKIKVVTTTPDIAWLVSEVWKRKSSSCFIT